MPTPTHDGTRSGTAEECYGPLLPGIPNDITVQQIAPKLPWTAFHVLSSVSRSWLKAIKSRHVYDARVRSNATEAFVVIGYRNSNYNCRIVLYSMKEDSCYHLPPIPELDPEIPSNLCISTCSDSLTPTWSKCICLDGRVYALGVRMRADYDSIIDRVYVFDMAGERQWKQCARMIHSTQYFECGVAGGKIYLFEEFHDWALHKHDPELVRGSRLYDPNEDVWSPIKPMPTFRVNYKVMTVGDEILVYGGERYSQVIDEVDDGNEWRYYEPFHGLEIYNPVQNEWRIVEPFDGLELMWRIVEPYSGLELMVTVGEKTYNVTHKGMAIYNMDASSWSFVQSFSYNFLSPLSAYDVAIRNVVALDDGLLGVINWNKRADYRYNKVKLCLMRTRLLGMENKESVWCPSQCSLSFAGDAKKDTSMCLIQL